MLKRPDTNYKLMFYLILSYLGTFCCFLSHCCPILPRPPLPGAVSEEEEWNISCERSMSGKVRDGEGR